MNRMARYRPLLLAVLASTVCFTAGCENSGHMQTVKEENRARWNETRIGVLYQLALQQYQVGDYDKCKETLAQALATGHPHALTSILAAKVALEKGTLEDASNYLKAAIQIDSNNPEAYYLLGVTYQRWQNNQAAHDYYKLALDHKPNEALYLLAVVEMKIALGHNDEAQTLMQDKLVYFEQSAGIRAALARLHTLKKEYDLATPLYREASILSPDDVNLRESYAESLYFSGRYADVVPILEDLRNNPDITDKKTVTTLLGESYLKVHRVRDARTVFAEQTREDPNDNAAWVHLGNATLALGDYQQSSGVAQRVLKVEPENVDALELLALSRQRLGQWQSAQDTLLRARSLSPKDPTILCMMGLGAQHLGQKSAAVEFYSQAVDADPQDAWAQELYAAAKPVIIPAPASVIPDHTQDAAPGAQSQATPAPAPIAQAKPVSETTPIVAAQPVAETTPVAEAKPVTETTPISQSTPVADATDEIEAIPAKNMQAQNDDTDVDNGGGQ